MTAHLSEDDIMDMALGESVFNPHAETCPDCAKLFQQYRELLGSVSLTEIPSSDILQNIRKEARRGKQSRPFFLPAWGVLAMALVAGVLVIQEGLIQQEMTVARLDASSTEGNEVLSIPQMEVLMADPKPSAPPLPAKRSSPIFVDNINMPSEDVAKADDESMRTRLEDSMAFAPSASGLKKEKSQDAPSLTKALFLEKDGLVIEALDMYARLLKSPPKGVKREEILTKWIFALHRAGRKDEAREKLQLLNQINPTWVKSKDLRWE